MTPLVKEGTYSRLSALLVLSGTFLVMLVVLSLIIPGINGAISDKRTAGLLVSALQAIMIFIIPSFVYARYVSFHPLECLSLDIPPRWKSILWIILIYITATPFMNQIIYWNSELTLPASMSGLEKYIRAMEDQAMELTEIMLDTSSLWGMVAGVLVIGIITGIGEELFFRGSIQKIITNKKRKWISVWFTAVIFSAFHFQFYGFVPRLLLGAFFGYLLIWSGSVWLPIIAHAFNNSTVVVTGWLIHCGFINPESTEMLGVCKGGVPVPAIISLILTLIILVFGHKIIFSKIQN